MHGTALLHAALVVCASFHLPGRFPQSGGLSADGKNAGRTAGGGRFSDVGGLRP